MAENKSETQSKKRDFHATRSGRAAKYELQLLSMALPVRARPDTIMAAALQVEKPAAVDAFVFVVAVSRAVTRLKKFGAVVTGGMARCCGTRVSRSSRDVGGIYPSKSQHSSN